ncbi:MAG: hypothetical protein ACRDNJ_17270, partial [Solirubrobacteraceae bacterium]
SEWAGRQVDGRAGGCVGSGALALEEPRAPDCQQRAQGDRDPGPQEHVARVEVAVEQASRSID